MRSEVKTCIEIYTNTKTTMGQVCIENNRGQNTKQNIKPNSAGEETDKQTKGRMQEDY